MKLFISYAAEDTEVAEQIQLALLGAGHEVFFDKESLPVGGDFHRKIQSAVEASDRFVFLISPDSVARGSYALTELRYARDKWPHPKEKVAPVMVRQTAWDEIPNYLKSVTMLQPVGNIPAAVVAAIGVPFQTAQSPALGSVGDAGGPLSKLPESGVGRRETDPPPPAHDQSGKLSAHWLERVPAIVSAIAAAVSVVAAILASKSEMRLRESFETAAALAEWSKNLTQSGGHCAATLAQFSSQQFKEFANRTSNRLLPGPFLDRCKVGYDKSTFDPENDLVLNEQERSYLAHQVVAQLNNYEALALRWDTLGVEAKGTICAQAKLPPNSPYRAFKAVAEGTEWWNYPKLSKFMESCRD